MTASQPIPGDIGFRASASALSRETAVPRHEDSFSEKILPRA
jgi:hypothetical protein